jgi:hypothetical protein
MRLSGANTENVVTLVFGPADCRNVYAEEEVQRATRKIADHRYHSLKRRFRPIVGFTGACVMADGVGEKLRRIEIGMEKERHRLSASRYPQGLAKTPVRCGDKTLRLRQRSLSITPFDQSRMLALRARPSVCSACHLRWREGPE